MITSLSALLLAGYFGVLFLSVWQASLPSTKCDDPRARSCVTNLIGPGDDLALELWLLQEPSGLNETDVRFRWTRIESCRFNVTLPKAGLVPAMITDEHRSVCNVTLPESARVRWSSTDDKSHRGGPLRAAFRFRLPNRRNGSSGQTVAEVPFLLTRIVDRSILSPLSMSQSSEKARKLLEEPSDNAASGRSHDYIPFLKYGSHPVVIRYVAEERPYGGPPFARTDGIELSVLRWDPTHYRPIMYIDENALQHAGQREVAPPADGVGKPPVRLHIQLSSVSPMRDSINRQITIALQMLASMFPGSELDEFRYWLRDERLYRFCLTQVISFFHVWVDWLAFRDEVRFYRGKTNFDGVSVSSVISRLVCSLIIFLYLLDGGGTSWVVLLSVFGSVSVDAWKACKMLRPTWQRAFPFVRVRGERSTSERATATYDRIAITYLGLFLYPVVIGWSIYALQHYVYRSWYSWLVSNLANAVYTFGFIALCPQLYVNYRLKSVAHLPWKVFLYKTFNTFVDDVFAFLIDMPWKHRIMTLRDDVVFLLFLFQAYLYQVDKTRTNEFGYAYEEDQSTKQEKADAALTSRASGADNKDKHE